MSRPLGWRGPPERVIPFATVAEAIAYGRSHLLRRSWEASALEINMPGSKALWEGKGWLAGHARSLWVRSLRGGARNAHS